MRTPENNPPPGVRSERKALSAGLMLVCILILSGCTTHRLNQFDTFAAAGKTYSANLIMLTREAGSTAVDADSSILITIRPGLIDPSERMQRMERHTREVKALLTVLSDLRRQTMLLESYFHSLSRLASSDLPAGISTEADNLMAALEGIAPALTNAAIGGIPVKDFIQKAVPVIVARFQHAALEKELQMNAAKIERQLELQRAVLEALVPELQSDFDTILKYRQFQDVARPYYADTPQLPQEWMKTRNQALTPYIAMGSAQSARNAARDLKHAFIALVEKRVTPRDFELLFADINAMIDFAEVLNQGAPQ